MLCRSCGSQIPEGSLFCIHCGERADAMLSAPEVQYVPEGAPYPYPPQSLPGKPLSKGKKALIFGGGGALALAVVLILVLTLSGGGGLLSGNTVQTRFFNDSARFFAEMMDGLILVDSSRIMNEPFEYTTKASTEAYGFSTEEEMAMAYDEHMLGIMIENGDSTTTLQLSDRIVMDTGQYVQVIEFGSDRDMDAAMTLEERITAMLTSGKTNVDYKKLIEMLVNSIPEDCFEKTGDGFTMTLGINDIVDTLNAFAE